jgi:hypothetical protein
MTIDERLGALTQALELWPHMSTVAKWEYWEMSRANRLGRIA